MIELNKYILVAMNPLSTEEELINNSKEAYKVAKDAIGYYVKDIFISSANIYDCVVSNTVNYHNKDNKRFDKYFASTYDKREKYLDAINKINKKKKNKEKDNE